MAAMWLVLASVFLPALRCATVVHTPPVKLAGFRPRACLANGTAPMDRRNLSIGGVEQPLKIGSMYYGSSEISAWFLKIIFEDVLGINVDLWEYTRIPTGAILGTSTCDTHITVSIRDIPETLKVKDRLKRDLRDKAPIELGNLGYSNLEGLWIKTEIADAARQEDSLSLDFFRTYTQPHYNITRFFDRYDSFDRAILMPTRFKPWSGQFNLYEAATNDMNSRSLDPNWWLSPACRGNRSRCVPVITNGPKLNEVMQYAYWHRLPVALARLRNYNYESFVQESKTIFIHTRPSTRFVSLEMSRIIFPPYNERERSRGIFKTDPPAWKLQNYACRQLESRESEGMDQLMETVRNMRLAFQDVEELTRSLERSGNPELLACQWLREHKVPWETWIASATACIDGQGLTTKNGTFLASRSAEATGCRWCPPGRMSVQFLDAEGMTYQCKACDPGAYQADMGEASCNLCTPGRFTAANGTSSCELCPFGRFAAETASTGCDECPAKFTTAVMGSISFEECICQQGYFRMKDSRDVCVQCPRGMSCEKGSDEMAYKRQGLGG